MKGMSFSAGIFLRILDRAGHGVVDVLFPDGTRRSFGVGEKRSDVVVGDWEVFDLLFQKGDLGLAEAIIEGRMIVSDVAGLVEWACLNDQALGAAFRGKWYGLLAERLRRLLAKNTRRGSRKNIVAHYDLGNEFYRLWLDKTMTYSSALFQNPAAPPDSPLSLEAAQLAKYDRIIERLEIKPGDRILEVGCGWGGFFSRAVEKTGCQVTAVMNSPEQARHNRDLIGRLGMGSHVDLREMDYRDIEGRYDKVVSIEMIEAVGEEYWPVFFRKISGSLKQKGKTLIQGITIREDLFDSYRRSTDFIQQYVFQGGMLLTGKAFEEQGRKNQIHLAERFEFPESYAETLRSWRQNFDRAAEQVRAMGFDEKFIRMWRLYLAYCEGAFRAGRISVGHYLLER